MDKIRILIADDHAVVREGTRQILEQEEDLDVVAEAADGEEAIRLAGSSKPDIAIIDDFSALLTPTILKNPIIISRLSHIR